MIIKLAFMVLISSILFSTHMTYAEEELPLPEGKNIREWESISAALVVEERFEEAILYLDKILDEEPGNLKALSNKAGVLIKLERFSESLQISNKVLEIEPDRVSTLVNKAISLKMLRDYEGSFLEFSKILIIEPDNELIKKARANLLSGTPTVSTIDSKYHVHALVTIRNGDGNLIATLESTNARYLASLLTESWWNALDERGSIQITESGETFTKTNPLISEDGYIGMLTLEREMSGYKISIFEIFLPIVQLEESDIAQVQWTIIKN
tara:strand:+ start:592 stop:1398 length:807 start_codon:yes stop_codon:yes gene_type:complete